ncbi:FAD-dependent monooxygenase [Streptomyces sp. NPDC002133]|uniref:FAD-dependent monooxygenase n=1 Tax=Streptomyces sp. NPDC002133 TaxID=3154409 RepID=UPI00331D7A3F
MRKTSCGVAYAHGEADYNSHYGIRELCDICPSAQLDLCAGAWKAPDLAVVTAEARQLGAIGNVEVDERAIIVKGLDEQPRYYLQHGYGYQCHDRAKPHHHRRHGRADIDWPAPTEEVRGAANGCRLRHVDTCLSTCCYEAPPSRTWVALRDDRRVQHRIDGHVTEAASDVAPGAAPPSPERGPMPQRAATIVGGGVGGLAAAIALHRRGWRVEVLERAQKFAEIGAGISLWPNALHALEVLGLAGTVHALGAVEAVGGVRDHRGRRLSRADNAELARRFGHPLVVLHRADLLRALTEALPADSLRSGSEVHAVRDDGQCLVIDHRGGESRADLVVGADGLRSTVRRALWPDAAGPRYAGYTAWRMVTEPLSEPPSEGAATWGRGARLGYTALPGGRMYCFATASLPAGSASAPSEHAELLRRFGSWPDPIPELLAAVPADAVLRHDLYDLPPLSSFVRGRVALLGDAAHAMTPNLGQGACQALEDAVTLAHCLDGAPDVAAALRSYDLQRRPRTQAITRRSARLGAVGQLSWPPAVLLRNTAARLTPTRATLRSMTPVLGWTAPGAPVTTTENESH